MNPYAKVEAFNPMGCPPVPRCLHRRGDSRRDHLQQFLAGIRDIVGGRSAADEQELSRAREIAFEEMTERARSARTP